MGGQTDPQEDASRKKAILSHFSATLHAHLFKENNNVEANLR